MSLSSGASKELPLDEPAAVRQYAPMVCSVAFKKSHAPCMSLVARGNKGAG
jgi:hypothetical protein